MTWNIDDSSEKMERAKEWMQRLLDQLADGAIWMVPRSGAAYRFDKKNKIATSFSVNRDLSIEVVLKNIGWTIKGKGGWG
jgi:hypothetical protein